MEEEQDKPPRRQENERMKPQIPDNWPQRCRHKGIGLNRQEDAKDAKVVEKDLPRTHAALTGICRSGGSADTLIREFIRVSGCPPIHVRIADSAAFVANPFPIRVHPCASVCIRCAKQSLAVSNRMKGICHVN
jgi:hypothetical protein